MARHLDPELQEALDELQAVGEHLCPSCGKVIVEHGIWRHRECRAELGPAAVEALERARRLRRAS